MGDRGGSGKSADPIPGHYGPNLISQTLQHRMLSEHVVSSCVAAGVLKTTDLVGNSQVPFLDNERVMRHPNRVSRFIRPLANDARYPSM